MTARQLCPPAPGPLEAYAAQFDPLFTTLAQRRGFRDSLAGLLLPRDRHKTLTALAGAEPIVDAQAAPVQRLQFFVSEATWDAEAVTAQRLALLTRQSATTPHARGVLVLDDFGLKPLRPPGSEDLYDVINERYDRASIVLTSDRAEWPDLFGEALLASAALDRLTHGAHFVEITGASFRAEATKKQTAARRRRAVNEGKA